LVLNSTFASTVLTNPIQIKSVSPYLSLAKWWLTPSSLVDPLLNLLLTWR
jgi:hypothetical protein